MTTTDTALYIGEGGKYDGGLALISQTTVALVPAGEALLSDLWQPISPVPNPATSLPIPQWDGGTPTSPSTSTLDGGTP
jgi:hypothetical protein